MDDSSRQPQEAPYQALIKPGDAVETPDGELWVVLGALPDELLQLVSAYRAQDGRIWADAYEPTRTVLAVGLVAKVADARQVGP